MKNRILIVVVFLNLVFILSACNSPTARISQIIMQASGAKTWIDAPLDGALLSPQEPYPLVVHAYDPSGVAQLELSENGSLLTTLPFSAGDKLAVFKYEWLPKMTGNVLLLARTQGKDGKWNSESSVEVSIGVLSPTPTPTLASSATATPTPTLASSATATPTPTLAPSDTATPTPTLAKSGMGFTTRVSTNQVSYGGCGTSNVTIQVLLSNPSIVRDVVIFTKVKNQANGKSMNWDGGRGMSSVGNGWYQVTMSASSVENFNAYETSWLLYQIIVTGNGGAEVGRSQTFSEISLVRCAKAPAPPKNPTTPPFIPVRPIPTTPGPILLPILPPSS